ncbi:MAG TPA: preprotein translocase subunit SecG, partial [Thermoanaerobaculia bacterium]|nr:preprotein translocase subunit SecG [Thermoanaerobaculia bacterium]
MIYLLYFLHVLVCVFLILVVLLQQGKGADLSVFGGGSTQTAFGARGAATLLHKLTVVSFVVFILTTLGIGILKSSPGGSSVMSDVMEERSEEPLEPDPEKAAPQPGTPAQP